MHTVKIRSALISVFDKSGLDEIVRELKRLDVEIFSTGGTLSYIEKLGIHVNAVESLTSYPSILDGRVKTLHPKVFGGILARREEGHIAELDTYEIPAIDLVIVDLYPFEQTVRETTDEQAIIEKIDIGGISLIRAGAKNYRDVVVSPSKEEYGYLMNLLREKGGETDIEDRKFLAKQAFGVSSHYDTLIHRYFTGDQAEPVFKQSIHQATPLRYGENPHQQATYFGNLEAVFEKLSGKDLSFNNLVDIDAAMQLMREFKDDDPTFAVLKHTNACGVATRATVLEAWKAALAGDNVSAFGGILICNRPIDLATAEEIDQIFYEVLLAPEFEADARMFLEKKKKRVLLKIRSYPAPAQSFKSILNGVIRQDTDLKVEQANDLQVVTRRHPDPEQIRDLIFANKCAKHLKSNTIVLARDLQLAGMGCGQTSRVDALKQAVEKALRFGFDLKGAVMASDAFFPFSDCVEIAHGAGIEAVIQPGGSIRDQESIDFCDQHEMAMVVTGHRHFKH
ncbi:MAG: bifunctional phosphoribosylaminoimidazolecarboxamide formyltransferase/IMP cyclohydrolase [Saprospiraceae bacterium]|nr:bifunctional phosphoribosylaminoimidazolecarboxamide formyltransferase/IMP cyclohydrolase [Saprospiraceae bacterium]